MTDIIDRLSDEADQCRNDGADDIAGLLDDAGAEITRLRADLESALKDAIVAYGKLNGLHVNARGSRDRVRELEAECASLRAEVESLRAAAQAKPEGGKSGPAVAGWQQIETAPKDGTAVLVAEGRFIHCVEWNDEFDWWAVDDNKLGPFRLRGAAPTHWMPPPAAPSAEGGE